MHIRQTQAYVRSHAGNFCTGLFDAAITKRSLREILGFGALALLALALAVLFGYVTSPADPSWGGPYEDGVHETLQSLVLVAAWLCFAGAALKLDHEIFYFCVGAMVFCGFAAVRETPQCGSEFAADAFCLTSGAKLGVGVALIGVALALIALRRIPLAKRWADLNLFYVVPLAFTAALLFTGAWFEDMNRPLAEENFELAAYLNLLLFALLVIARPALFDARNRRASGPPHRR